MTFFVTAQTASQSLGLGPTAHFDSSLHILCFTAR